MSRWPERDTVGESVPLPVPPEHENGVSSVPLVSGSQRDTLPKEGSPAVPLTGPCRVCAEPVASDSRYCSGTCRQGEKDTWWALVKDKPSRDTRAWRWAKTHLGLIESGDSGPSASRRSAQHHCGWQLVDGTWRCVQDHYAEGWAPETGCGATWP